MNKNFKLILSSLALFAVLSACGGADSKLRTRATELCAHIPTPQSLNESRGYLTPDFYNVLDTLFNRLPQHEAMDHEWEHYFVASDGSNITDFEVTAVNQSGPAHAVARVTVRTEDEEEATEPHELFMEKVGGEWLISDFDGHRSDCIRHIVINRREQALRSAMSDYLVSHIGEGYLKGQLCVPVLLIAASDEKDGDVRVWGDFWVFWYNVSGDTLKTLSGGNHPGCMELKCRGGRFYVVSFEQAADGAGYEASARRIFGSHYDVFCNMHSSQGVREAARMEQLRDYVRRNGLSVRFCQDHGRDAVEL